MDSKHIKTYENPLEVVVFSQTILVHLAVHHVGVGHGCHPRYVWGVNWQIVLSKWLTMFSAFLNYQTNQKWSTSHMLHVWYIYLHDWVILGKGKCGYINIPAPWVAYGFSMGFPWVFPGISPWCHGGWFSPWCHWVLKIVLPPPPFSTISVQTNSSSLFFSGWFRGWPAPKKTSKNLWKYDWHSDQ